MSATTNNISVEQNVPYSFNINCVLSDGVSPLNVSSGYTFSCKIRADYQSSPLITLSLGNGISVSSSTPYPITISLTSAQTLSLPVTTIPTTLFYDVLMTQTNGAVNTMLVRGSISVVGAITR
jgi:hypothetical protein